MIAAGTPAEPHADARHRRVAKALPAHARAHNRAAVLGVLFHAGAASRADLARRTGLTRVTVSNLIAELLAQDLVVELGMRKPAGPGKPATLVDLHRRGAQIVSVDLSAADGIRAALTDLAGEVLHRRTAPRPARASQVGEVTHALASELMTEASARVLGVGVAAPPGEGIDAFRTAPFALPDLGVPLHVGTDTDAAGLAERAFGGATDDSLLVSVGRSVRAGVFVRGALVRGSRGLAGGIGHVRVGTDEGPRCACGRHGCLDAWLSMPSLRARIAAGDDPARVRREAGERLGIVLAPLVQTFDLSEVVLSGPAAHLDGELRQAAAETLRARVRGRTETTVRTSEQGEDAVLRGAAVLVLEGELGVS